MQCVTNFRVTACLGVSAENRHGGDDCSRLTSFMRATRIHVASFSQPRALSQYSRNLHKIFIQTGLCNVKKILSTRGHRLGPFCDEKEDWARLAAPLGVRRTRMDRERTSSLARLGSVRVRSCVQGGLLAALALTIAGPLWAQTASPAPAIPASIPPPRPFPAGTRATRPAAASGSSTAAMPVQTLQPRSSGDAAEAIPEAAAIPRCRGGNSETARRRRSRPYSTPH